MALAIPRIERPELFFGLVAPIGAETDSTLKALRSYLEINRYRVVDITVTNIFKSIAKYIPPVSELKRSPAHERYQTYIKYGNQLRSHFDEDAILAATAIGQIVRKRNRFKRPPDEKPYSRVAYLIHQFKRKEEVDLLRSVYGRLFFQISVYSRRGARVDALARKFASSRNLGQPEKYRSEAEQIIQVDEDEVDERHGQRVAKIFHDADFIVSLDAEKVTVPEQVHRFCEILFSSNSISPNHLEYGMFAAKAAALRTLDLSRQVGAAIFSEEGEIAALGSNEVPKGSGGTYWAESGVDAREYLSGYDSNDRRKRQLLTELLDLLDLGDRADELLDKKAIQDSQFMDALEYGRIVHAEMSAICDAARLGRAIAKGVLYCTTFPCHMCAKHIVATGISKVIFLEPYPKSLAAELHSDSLEIEGSDRGRYEKFPATSFEHFYGVTPRRYRELFERSKRKTGKGDFVPYATPSGTPQPLIDIKVPFYLEFEQKILEALLIIVKTDEVFGDE